MRLSEALYTLCRRRQDPAARALVQEAGRVVEEAIRRSARSAAKGADDGLEDVETRTLVKVLGKDILGAVREAHPDADDNEVDRRCGAYLRQMVRHAIIDALRAKQRRRSTGTDSVERLPASEEPRWIDVEELRRLLDAVSKEAVEARSPRYKTPLESAIRQVIRLATGEASMSDLFLAEGVSVSTSEADRIKVRNALYTAHKRARFELSAAADRLGARGALDQNDVDDVKRVIAQHLCRCQRTSHGNVPSAGKKP